MPKQRCETTSVILHADNLIPVMRLVMPRDKSLMLFISNADAFYFPPRLLHAGLIIICDRNRLKWFSECVHNELKQEQQPELELQLKQINWFRFCRSDKRNSIKIFTPLKESMSFLFFDIILMEQLYANNIAEANHKTTRDSLQRLLIASEFFSLQWDGYICIHL